MKNIVFNNSIGSPYAFAYPNLTNKEASEIISGLFEQLLIFDKISISTGRINFTLFFLINKLGINTVERLIDSGYIEFLLWSPIIMTSPGRQREDKTIDESVIYGQPPIVAGSLSEQDMDPEKNIIMALSHFNLDKDRKKIFTKKALKSYIIPNGMNYSTDSAKLVIDAYENNNLEALGLPYIKEANQLNVDERHKLLTLGHKIIETAILSNQGLKSYQNYESYEICKKNLENIGNAFNVSENTSAILKFENLPNLKELFINERIDFDSVFKIRHLSTAKYYRKWINEVSENINAQEVTREYINEIKGNKFFDTNNGKLLRNLFSFGVGAALGNALAGPIGTVVGLPLGLLDTFWLDSILKGKNPSMFIDSIRKEIKTE